MSGIERVQIVKRVAPQRLNLATNDVQTYAAKKAGPGRPPGSVSKLAAEAVARARETGELPHEFLLRVARGEVISTDVMNPVDGVITKTYQVPELSMRVDAAKAAAPYYAPKLSAVEVMSGMNDDALNQLIEGLAGQAGLAVGARGEGKAGEGEDGATGPAEGSWL